MAINFGAMSVPGGNPGDSSLGQQVAGESELERKKRLLAQKNQQQLPLGLSSLASGYGAALNTNTY
jgi:hypothetical protein